MRQISKSESLSKYNAFLDFCDTTNLHLEPALKSSNSKIYHTSNTIHTRIIDVKQDRIFDPNDIKLYYQIRNHDGYKLPHHLIKAEQLDMKLLGFVQAMIPSIFVTTRLANLFLKKMKIYKALYTETNKNIIYELGVELQELRQKELITNNCFNTEDFLHYRFWFFDLDYEYPVPLSDLVEVLKELNLFNFVNAIVQTSPTKYHIYIKSEMVATKAQVEKWPLPLQSHIFTKVLNPAYLDYLSEEYSKKTGWRWYEVARRGLPSKERLDSIPIPIPEEAILSKEGLYIGDDNVYSDYMTSYKEIATVLGADPRVCNETRNAQLVGYTNPKNGYVANVVYGCKDAPVLTTRIAKTVVHDSIQKFYYNYKYPFYIDSSVKKIDNYYLSNKEVLIPFENRKVVLDSSTDRYHIKTKPKTKFSKIPESPEEYCRIHGVAEEAIWDKDIYGSSNAMLLLFSRYAYAHIDLSSMGQQKAYFKTIIEPYFKNRVSKNLRKDFTLSEFFRRFQSNCRHNSKFLTSNKSNHNAQKKYSTSEQMQEVWINILKNALGEDHKAITSKGHVNLRRLICDHAVNYAMLNVGDGVEHLEFQIPASLLNEVHGYKDKLKFYESLGLYATGSSYTKPVRKGGHTIKAGQCKKHKLTLNAVDANVAEQVVEASKKVKTKASVKTKEEEIVVIQKEIQEVEPAFVTVSESVVSVSPVKVSPLGSINDLDVSPPSNRILTVDYVMNVVHAKSELLKEPIPVFIPNEPKAIVSSLGYTQNTLSDLMQFVVHKDNVCYSDIENNFNQIKDHFLGPVQQEADHENNDYQIKRAKIFNNLRPLNLKEMQKLSESDRMQYLFTVSDLVDVSKYCRDFIYGEDPCNASDIKIKYVLDSIEQQVIKMKNFMYMDLGKIELMHWIKRDLQAHIWQCDYICAIKQKRHKEFLSTLDDDIEVLFRHSGSLFRDYNRKMNEGKSHGGYLSPSQAIQYDVPVELSKEESMYYRPIDNLVDQLKIMYYRIPYNHREKDSIKQLMECRSSVIEKSLKSLKSIA